VIGEPGKSFEQASNRWHVKIAKWSTVQFRLAALRQRQAVARGQCVVLLHVACFEMSNLDHEMLGSATSR